MWVHQLRRQKPAGPGWPHLHAGALPIGPLMVTAGQLCAVFGLCLPLKSCPPNTAGEPHGKRPGLVTLALTTG